MANRHVLTGIKGEVYRRSTIAAILQLFSDCL
jgi:hypothetical protein